MPFPVDVKYIKRAEEKLGLKLPLSYVASICKHNGGSVSAYEDTWFLHPIFDLGMHAECFLGARGAALLRDIFGPLPFRTVTIEASWLTPKAISISEVIYERRSFDRMPELAQTVEEAGCTNQDILNHCRGPGPHVKGCWVVDLVLGKN
jgi:hypothetical protein